MFHPVLESFDEEVAKQLESAWSVFCENSEAEHLPVPDSPEFLKSLARVWASSQFVTEQCVKNPLMFSRLRESGRLNCDASASFKAELSARKFQNEADLMKQIREFRNLEMVRIAWRDIAGIADIEATLKELSLLAEACLEVTLSFVFDALCERYGVPRSRNSEVQIPVILGMGKLGAWELNFSSDIDLIFAYEDDGVLDDRRSTTYSEFYTQVCRSLIRVIDSVTSDGFVFRVDTRLRPFGDSGPLVMSFSAMESYYQSHAREWERYALIKIRPVAGDLDAGESLLDVLRPFVYRRYIDYGAFGELRQLKSRISQELKRKDREQNIKLGPGGIREIEFIGQAYQLIRGGQDPRLQKRRILDTLNTMKKLSLLPEPVIDKLVDGYRFLRVVENRLQQYADQQVHEIPQDPRVCYRLAIGLGFDSWLTAKPEIDRVRNQIHEIFEQVFVSPQSDNGHGDAERIWLTQDTPEVLELALETFGYQDPRITLKKIADFRNAHAIRNISSRGAECLDTLIPMLLAASASVPAPGIVLARLLDLVEAIASRHIYLSLLTENPLAVSQLVKLASASSWIVAFISRHPLLLDELLDTRRLYAPLSKAGLREELDQRLGKTDASDLEHYLSEMREFRQAQVLRVAAADIMGAIPVSTVSDYLTDIAEVVVENIMLRAWVLVAEKHGVPPGCKQNRVDGFGIVGYGKFGGLELGYGSDLDLVFLYGGVSAEMSTDGRKPITSVEFYARVGRRLINLLDTKMLSGILYGVDMRLRPSGTSGLLVSHVDGFEKYQKTSAWTWEHQALVRARFICGSSQVAERFSAIRQGVLSIARDPSVLKADVISMREKMRDGLSGNRPSGFDLKQGAGGIVDIEFIVQFGALLHAQEYPELVKFSDTARLLEILQRIGFLIDDEAEILSSAYFCYRDQGHRAALQEKPAIVPMSEFADIRTRVQDIWRRIMG